jgi:hypothetical protein
VDQERIKQELRQALIEYFDESELRTLCFDLGVDYDGLSGIGKADKARELVGHFWRRGHLMILAQMIEVLRSDTRRAGAIRRFLRESAQTTQEIDIAVLRRMRNTGPMGIDLKTVLALNEKINRLTWLIYIAAGASLLSLVIVLLTLIL